MRTLVITLVITVIVGAAAGFGGAMVKGKSYDSVAQLTWDPSSLRYTNSTAFVPDSTSLGVQLNTQALKVLSDAVIDPAGESLGMTPTALRNDLTATASSDTNEISIQASAVTAKRAQAVASEVTQQYQDQVRADFTAQYRQQVSALQTAIDRLRLQIAATPASSSSLADNLASQLASLTAEQEILRGQAADAQTPLSLVREPTADAGPSGPSTATLTIIGGGLGLLIGIALFALVRSLRLARIQQAERLETRPIRRNLPAA